MAREFATSCDACGEILYGNFKKAFVTKPYIQIRGQLALQQQKVGESQDRFHVFVTSLNQEEICVCNLECLKTLMDMKTEWYLNKREKELRK